MGFVLFVDKIEEIIPQESIAEGSYYAKGGLVSLFDGLEAVGNLYVYDTTELFLDIPVSAVTQIKIYNAYFDFGEFHLTFFGKLGISVFQDFVRKHCQIFRKSVIILRSFRAYLRDGQTKLSTLSKNVNKIDE